MSFKAQIVKSSLVYLAYLRTAKVISSTKDLIDLLLLERISVFRIARGAYLNFVTKYVNAKYESVPTSECSVKKKKES